MHRAIDLTEDALGSAVDGRLRRHHFIDATHSFGGLDEHLQPLRTPSQLIGRHARPRRLVRHHLAERFGVVVGNVFLDQLAARRRRCCERGCVPFADDEDGLSERFGLRIFAVSVGIYTLPQHDISIR